MPNFDVEFEAFLLEQKKTAKGRRLEMLQKDLTGERKMFSEVLWPVFKSFHGFILEHEIVNTGGFSIFMDAFYEPLGLAFESEGYAYHAENITRDRFSFERSRVRTIASRRYVYIPFSWDELDKKKEACQASIYELLGKFGLRSEGEDFSLQEKELLLHALRLNRPFRLMEVKGFLKAGRVNSMKVLQKLEERGLILPNQTSGERRHFYEISKDAVKDLLYGTRL